MSSQGTQSLTSIKVLVLNLFHQTKMVNYSPHARQLEKKERNIYFHVVESCLQKNSGMNGESNDSILPGKATT